MLLEKQFLQFMREAPAEQRLAALCILTYDLEEYPELVGDEITGQTRGTYKRSIAYLRGLQAQAKLTGNQSGAEICENTIAFMRRELMGKAATAARND